MRNKDIPAASNPSLADLQKKTIQKVELVHDYSLCPNTTNSFTFVLSGGTPVSTTLSGKYTLTEIKGHYSDSWGSANTVSRTETGRAHTVEKGEVVYVREVTIEGEARGGGGIAGDVLGFALGNTIGGACAPSNRRRCSRHAVNARHGGRDPAVRGGRR